MPLLTLTLDELIQLARDVIRNRIPGADVSEGSDYDLKARAFATVVQGNQHQALFLADQILPGTAEKAYLEEHGALRGVPRAQAAKAQGKVLLVFPEGGTPSTANTTQPSGSVLTHADGTAYKTTADATSAKPVWTGKTTGVGSTVQRIVVNPDVVGMLAGDILDISGVPRAIAEVHTAVNAIDLYEALNQAPTPGSTLTARRGVLASILADTAEAAGNKPVGDSLTLAAPAGSAPNQFSATTYVQELTGGGDLEVDSEYRDSIRAFMANRPGSGNPEDYRQWSRATPGVRIADAFVYPGFRGLGTVDIVLWGLAGARLVGASVISAVQTYLESVAPGTDDLVVKTYAYKATPTAIHVKVLPRVGYEPDWNAAPFSVPASPASSTTRIYVVLSPAGIVEVGDRVLVPLTVAGRARLHEAKVTALGTGGVPYFLDVETMPAAPVTSAAIYSGGPLAQPIIDAIDALFDALGPGVTTAGVTYMRHPSNAQGANHKLRPAHVIDTIMELAGVANVEIGTLPTAGDEPAAQEILQLGALTIEHVTS